MVDIDKPNLIGGRIWPHIDKENSLERKYWNYSGGNMTNAKRLDRLWSILESFNLAFNKSVTIIYLAKLEKLISLHVYERENY